MNTVQASKPPTTTQNKDILQILQQLSQNSPTIQDSRHDAIVAESMYIK